jgi:ferredoxin
MKCNVEESQCIGCGACAAVYGEVFEINEQGISVVKDETKATPDMADICPCGAITVEEAETTEEAAA